MHETPQSVLLHSDHSNLPSWLNGTLYWNGPMLHQIEDFETSHWFDGLAGLQKWTFTPRSHVLYNARMVRSPLYHRAIHHGQYDGIGVGTNPHLSSVLQRPWGVFAANPSIAVVPIDDSIVLTNDIEGWAIDTPTSVDMMPQQGVLAKCTGVVCAAFKGAIKHTHPAIDPVSRRVFTTQGPLLPVRKRDGRLEARYDLVELHVRDGLLHTTRLASIHTQLLWVSHAAIATPNFIILKEDSNRLSLPALTELRNSTLFDWLTIDPLKPLTFRLFNQRTHSLSSIDSDIKGVFSLHMINAHDVSSEQVNVTLLAHETMDVAPLLETVHMFEPLGDNALPRTCLLLECSIQSHSAHCEKHRIGIVELPTINPLWKGRHHRYTYALSLNGLLNDHITYRIVKYDHLLRIVALSWAPTSFPAPAVLSEARFVPSNCLTNCDEDAGLLLVMATTKTQNRLFILNASSFQIIDSVAQQMNAPPPLHSMYCPSDDNRECFLP